jgi:iduronate 2-sulfatase
MHVQNIAIMNNSLLIKYLLLTIFAYPIVTACQVKKEQQTPYNVLFIAVDDLRTELNCYGADHIKSPNIDRLAANGVRFNKAFVQQAICMASRASLMSGIRPEKLGIYTGESVEDIMPDILTLNKFFKQNGYTISSCGKIYHFGEDTKKQFGEDYIAPKQTWEGSGYVTKESIKKQALNTRTGRGPAYENADVNDTIYKDGINTLNAVRKLEQLKNSDKPFFMAVGLTKPHLPFCAPKKYWDMYPEESVTLSKLKDRPENSNKYTMRTGGELSNYAGMPQKFSDVDDQTALVLRRAYYACVSYVDAQVGILMDQLDKLGMRENTIVVLWGDHGYKLGDYDSWCKWSNMNIDTRVPLLFSVPNGNQGKVCNKVVEALDIYPTLAELCGLEKPAHLEGESLKPLLDNPSLKSSNKKYAYTIWPDNRWDYDKTVMGYSIKDERFNYVEWVKLNTGEILERELYDHSIDPEETKNMIGNSEYDTVASQLTQQCIVLKDNTDHDHSFKKLR